MNETSAHQRRLERKERRHENRRKVILDAARSILARDGIQNFSVNSVARAADVSKPAVYYYFESKEELVYELAVDAEREEAETIQAALARDAGGVGALEAMLEAYVAHYVSNLDKFRLRYVWPQVLGIHGRLLEAQSHQRTLEVDALVSKRLDRDRVRVQDRLRPSLEAAQVTRLARVMAHGIVAQACHSASTSAAAQLNTLELCRSACEQMKKIDS
jgi:AcrR family transcriptional regulator